MQAANSWSHALGPGPASARRSISVTEKIPAAGKSRSGTADASDVNTLTNRKELVSAYHDYRHTYLLVVPHRIVGVDGPWGDASRAEWP